MRIPIYQIDAFTTRLFAGNPAAVMLLERFLDDETLQALAAENNLADTAFLVPDGADYQLRWFTPAIEVPLCGHATLASAALVLDRLEPERTSVVFHTASGALTARRHENGYVLDFPALPCPPIPIPPALVEALGVAPTEVCADFFSFMVVIGSAKLVREMVPNMAILAGLETSGVIVTAPGDEGYDFVSRFFAPGKGIPEDMVTGSAHCRLAPYWANRLGKNDLRAFQASPRGGEVYCRVVGDRVELHGSCAFYMAGEVEI